MRKYLSLLLILGIFLLPNSVIASSEKEEEPIGVYPPKVGPRRDIQKNRAMFWMQGNPKTDADVVYGRIILRGANKSKISQFFPLERKHDWFATVSIGGLKPGEYTYRMGYTNISDRNALKGRHFKWEQEEGRLNGATFTWYPETKTGSFVIASTSCHYPYTLLEVGPQVILDKIKDWFPRKNPLEGFTVNDIQRCEKKAKTFKLMERHLDSLEKEGIPCTVVRTGDQIYADYANVVEDSGRNEEFETKYEDAWTTPYNQNVLAKYPNKMTGDDHEFWNDADQVEMEKFPERTGIAALWFERYQLMRTVDANSFVMGQHWRPDSISGARAFFMDLRTERIHGKQITSTAQRNELINFLTTAHEEDPDGIKIIVGSVPFFPDFTDGNKSDKWSGYPEDRRQILEVIHKLNINKVFAIGGDIHCSVTAQLISNMDEGRRLTSVIFSPAYWPYGVLGHSTNFETKKPVATLGGHAYKIQNMSEIVSQNNFGLVQFNDERTRARVKIITYEKGNRMGKVAVEKDYTL